MKKILITGGAGFIGSSLIEFLNKKGITNIDIYHPNWHSKWENLNGLKFNGFVSDEQLYSSYENEYDAIILLGGNSSTKAQPSEEVWGTNYIDPLTVIRQFHSSYKKPTIIFASSGSVYGLEEKDFSERVDGLKPLNFYAFTKLMVDKTILEQQYSNVISFRFFNVYGGSREVFKQDMRSVISKWMLHHEYISLFRSNRHDIPHGHQSRDFIHVDDICKVIYYTIQCKNPTAGIYNLGSGVSTSYQELAEKILIKKFGKVGDRISYIPLEKSLEKQYQYYTCANIDKLRNVLGYKEKMITIDEGLDLIK